MSEGFFDLLTEYEKERIEAAGRAVDLPEDWGGSWRDGAATRAYFLHHGTRLAPRDPFEALRRHHEAVESTVTYLDEPRVDHAEIMETMHLRRSWRLAQAI